MRFKTLMVGALLVGLVPITAHAELIDYQQDFELLDRTDPNALAGDGWLLFAAGINGIDGSLTYGNFGAGPFAAPNNIASPNISVISDVASGGSPPAGNQGLVFFSDYGSGLHSDVMDPRDLVLSLFQERTVAVDDIGKTVTFSWLADGNSAPPTGDASTEAFMLTLDPNNGFAATNNLAFDTTATADGALATNSLTLSLTDPALIGQILQFGFRNTASDGEGSAMDYDNVSFTVSAVAIPEPSSFAAMAVAVSGAVLYRRRRRK